MSLDNIKQRYRDFKIILSDWLKLIIVFVRYTKKIKEIKSKKEAVEVFFFVNENQKWNCDSLYKSLDVHSSFNPTIALTKLSRDTNEDYYKNLSFFKDKGYRVIEAFDISHNQGLSLRNFKPDIVFYQQPYSFLCDQTPYKTSKFSLICYIPYGLMVANNNKNHYQLFFQKILWKYFSPNTIIKELYLENAKYTKASKIVVSGHPKMDIYQTLHTEEVSGCTKYKKKTIIYAPHHSFEDNSPLRYATFQWNGLEILNLAKNNQSIRWIFKPHPRLKYALEENGILSNKEINSYYESWHELDNCEINDSGDYFSLFKSSDCLITDCGSFLAEYLPTKKPIILLVNPKSSGYNRFGQILVNSYYKAHDFCELNNLITKVVINEQDDKKDERLQMMEDIKMNHTLAGEKIVKYLANTLKK